MCSSAYEKALIWQGMGGARRVKTKDGWKITK
jgi:hypothetical protein